MPLAFLCAVLASSCVSAPATGSKPADTTAAAREATVSSAKRGKGLRITVPAPVAKSIPEANSWVPQVIQDLMTTGFSDYTDMTVIDRSNEALIVEEQKRSERAIYSDEYYLEVGKITQAQYILAGSILNAGGTYRLALSVNDGSTNEVKASFNEAVSLDDIQNGNATNAALSKLIPALGFDLTAAEKARLSAKMTSSKSQDQKTVSTVNLAKGMAAEQKKNTVEALAYYASSMTKEAAIRYDSISSTVLTGNIREDVKNDIAARNEWLKMYEDLQMFINKNGVTLSYDVRPGEYKTDYKNNTVTIPFTVSYAANETAVDVYRQIASGLSATGKKDKWRVNRSDFMIENPTYIYTFELKNDKGKLLGTWEGTFTGGLLKDALYNVDRDIARNQQAEQKATASRSIRFTHMGGSSNRRDNTSKSYQIEFEKIPYTDITDSLSFGLTKIEVYQKNSYSRRGSNVPDIVNPPIEVTVLGVAEAKAGLQNGRIIESAAEPAALGTYKKGDRGPAGGIVFEVNKDGFQINGKTYHYAEVSPVILDLSSKDSATLASMVSASGHTLKKIGSTRISNKWGGGFYATNELMKQAAEKGYKNIVSKISSYSYGGFNDWYIPGDDEIDSIGYWLDWSTSSSVISGRNELHYLFTWEGAISLAESAYQGSQYTSWNIVDWKGYWDIDKANCILFVRAF